MKASLKKLCEDFIANRDVVAQAFKWDINYIYPVCANVFCSHGRTTSLEELKQARNVIEESTGLFSNFRGNIRPVLAAMLAQSDDPRAQMERAKEYYDLLKREFWSSEYLAMVAFLLTDLVDRDRLARNVARGKTIYQLMKQEHPFLTGNEDSVFAVLMAFSDKSDAELIADMETCYSALKQRFSVGDSVQTASHVLAMTEGAPSEKAARMIGLYDALREAGVKYGRHYELASLAALSLTDVDISTLTAEIKEVDEFLKTQKGYGFLGLGAQQRAMNAAMLVSDQYTARDQTNTAAMTSTLAMIIAHEIAMCVIATSTATAAAANS